MLFEILFLIGSLWLYFYWRFRKNCHYWTDRGIRQLDNATFPLGNNVLTRASAVFGYVHPSQHVEEQYGRLKQEPFYGSYGPGGRPILTIVDLDIIKDILGEAL